MGSSSSHPLLIHIYVNCYYKTVQQPIYFHNVRTYVIKPLQCHFQMNLYKRHEVYTVETLHNLILTYLAAQFNLPNASQNDITVFLHKEAKKQRKRVYCMTGHAIIHSKDVLRNINKTPSNTVTTRDYEISSTWNPEVYRTKGYRMIPSIYENTTSKSSFLQRLGKIKSHKHVQSTISGMKRFAKDLLTPEKLSKMTEYVSKVASDQLQQYTENEETQQ